MRAATIGERRLVLLRGDITKLGRHVGAIVNAANASLRPGGGVCGAIHAAGGPEIAIECRWIGTVPVGRTVATTAGNLDADLVLHTVGPVWQGGARDEDRHLASAYRTALELAAERELTSVAFPSISTGIFGYPVGRAARVAIGTVAAFLRRGGSVSEVLLVTYADEDYDAFESAFQRWEDIEAARTKPPETPPPS